MRILLIPPDVRPYAFAQPIQLARMAGADVRVPPPRALPNLNEPGDTRILHDWLLEEARSADAAIVSLETLTLGGQLPARLVPDAPDAALSRLRVLEEAQRLNPKLRILASGVIMRVAPQHDPLLEKPYYDQWGPELRAFSAAFDQHARQSGTDKAVLDATRAAIPTGILTDWLGTRDRNRAVHFKALEDVRSGLIEHLCLTLDDAAPTGLPAHDRHLLEARVDELNVWQQVDIYPGSDEVPVTLLTRLLREGAPRVYVRYSGASGATASTLHEDRPVGELVTAHLRAAGCVPADTRAGADFVLAVNTPAERQGTAQPDHLAVDTPHRHLPAFVDFLHDCLERGQRVSMADIAYESGAERRLWHMMRALPLARLGGYAAWNTAANSLGSAIAMGALPVRDERARLEALFCRFVDDAIYQGEVRAKVRSQLTNPSSLDLGDELARANELIADSMQPKMRALWEAEFSHVGYRLRLGEPHLAWPRLSTGVFPLEVQ